jgi:hypothetical protein
MFIDGKIRNRRGKRKYLSLGDTKKPGGNRAVHNFKKSTGYKITKF